MPFNYRQLPGALPNAAGRVELCYDRAKTTVWLEFTNTDYIVGGSAGTLVTALIGAVRGARDWSPINFGDALRLKSHAVVLGNALGPNVAEFQRAICRSWSGTDLTGLAKGLTFGQDQSSAGFLMKALKTGFDAIGEAMHAYSGLRVKGFTVDEVVSYMTKRATAQGVSVVDGGLLDFQETPPAPGLNEDIAKQSDSRTLSYIKSGKKHGGRFAYSAETDKTIPREFTRVIGYGFRGDSRPPSAIKSAGGFNPNYTRPDQIEKAKLDNAAQDQALNLESFLANQFYGGYISVTRSYAVAKGFATGMGGTTGGRGPGWVYACFVEGGFIIPPASLTPQTFTLQNGKKASLMIKYNEQEISMPGLLDWEDVVACRKVAKTGSFEGNVYIRRSLITDDFQAANKIWKQLSGETQGAGL